METPPPPPPPLLPPNYHIFYLPFDLLFVNLFWYSLILSVLPFVWFGFSFFPSKFILFYSISLESLHKCICVILYALACSFKIYYTRFIYVFSFHLFFLLVSFFSFYVCFAIADGLVVLALALTLYCLWCCCIIVCVIVIVIATDASSGVEFALLKPHSMPLDSIWFFLLNSYQHIHNNICWKCWIK